MAIKVQRPQVIDGSSTCLTFDLFEGRVLKVEQVTETRNHSDTLDYSDHRSTKCTYALVWLGTNNLPPKAPQVKSTLVGRPMRHAEVYSFEQKEVRDLEFHEQFAWIDCTNLFEWRGSDRLTPTVDAEMGKNGDPLMWANYIAWQGYMKGLEHQSKLMAEEDARLEEERRLKAEAKAQKSLNQKAVVEGALLKTPAKGTEVTYKDFTGKVFWKGVKQYRGKWRGTVGLKNNYGEVCWVDVSHWVAV